MPDVEASLRDYRDRLGLSVDALKRPSLDFIAPPVPRDGPFYAGRRAATVVGSAGELIELVEIA